MRNKRFLLIIGGVIVAILFLGFVWPGWFRGNGQGEPSPVPTQGVVNLQTIEADPTRQSTPAPTYTPTLPDIMDVVYIDPATIDDPRKRRAYDEMEIPETRSCTLGNEETITYTLENNGGTLHITSNKNNENFTITKEQVSENDTNHDGWVLLPNTARGISVGYTDKWRIDFLDGCKRDWQTPPVATATLTP